MENREIEVKFLEVNVPDITKRLVELGARDLGEDLLREIIFYDPALTWPALNKFVRIRGSRHGNVLTYKLSDETSVDGTTEIEVSIDNADQGRALLEAIGLVAYREQEKTRRSFLLEDVMVDIDTWPKIPTYVELEGPLEQSLHDAADKLGFDWEKKVTGTASHVIQDYYHIPVKKYKYFTFIRQE